MTVRTASPTGVDLEQMRPVFIAGQYRSGTSLMNAILSNHTNLAIAPKDRDWWTTFYPRYRRVRRSGRWRAFLDELFSSYKTLWFGIDVTSVRRQAHELPIGDFAGVFALLLSAYAAAEGKPRWGEKTPFTHRYAERILADYPQAQIVHMIRDPRDVFASMHYARFTSGLHYWLVASPGWVIGDWLESVRLGERFEARYPDRYRVVRYEHLVSDPELVVQGVCEFLGETFQPDMLTMSSFPFIGGGETNSSFEEMQGISRVSVGRHRQVLSAGQVWLCERLAGTTLTRQGYKASNTEPNTRLRLSARDWLGLIGYGLPATVAQIGGRWAIRIVRVILPRWTERKPRANPGLGNYRLREKVRATKLE
jgi:hypothetical protein